MRPPRIYTPQPLAAGDEVALDGRASRHATRVLRLRSGQPVILFNGDGTDHEAVLTSCARAGCLARVGPAGPDEPADVLRIHLGIGISRGERMDLAIQKSVELGVAAISPLRTERTVVQLDPDRLARRVAHWQGVVVSACEQCGRRRLPVLHAPSDLRDWLAGHPGGLLLHHAADRPLAALAPPRHGVTLLVGPEGGLSEAERLAAGRAGFTSVRLGPRVLRTETAPLAALAAMQALWGDFR